MFRNVSVLNKCKFHGFAGFSYLQKHVFIRNIVVIFYHRNRPFPRKRNTVRNTVFIIFIKIKQENSSLYENDEYGISIKEENMEIVSAQEINQKKQDILEETIYKQNSSMNNTENSLELQIEGLNVQEGIANSGSKELFFSLLGYFYKLIDQKSTKIEKCLADGMLKDYTIEVHALKSTARMIGAMELSEKFYRLEQLGNAEEQKILE